MQRKVNIINISNDEYTKANGRLINIIYTTCQCYTCHCNWLPQLHQNKTLKTPFHHHCNFFLCKIEIVLGSVTACFESFYQQWEIPLNPRLIGSLSYTKSMNFSANSTFFELFCASPFLQGKKSRLLDLMRIKK